MNQLITNNAIISPEISAEVAELEKQMKLISDKQKAFKSEILRLMEEHGVIKIDNDYLTITYVAETDRETFDTKAFREAHPDTYDEYVKIGKVAPSIRIKVK